MQTPTNTFKLLSDDTRLRILMLLYVQDLCVCQLSGILNAPQPKISKHLAKLRDLQIVQDLRREKFVFYSLKREDAFLLNILEVLSTTTDQYPVFQKDAKSLLIKDEFLNRCDLIESVLPMKEA